MELETFEELNYRYHAAGKVWNVPVIVWTRLPDGGIGLSQAEIERIHLAIANSLCGGTGALFWEQFEFLTDVGSVTFTEIAEFLDVHRSTISRWRVSEGPLSRLYSNALKRFFWYRLFGATIANQTVTISTAYDDTTLLREASERAISSGLVGSISGMEAA